MTDTTDAEAREKYIAEIEDALVKATRERDEAIWAHGEIVKERDQARQDEADGRFRYTRTPSGEELVALRARLAALEKEHGDWVELEARFCPEDVGFDEYIATLTHKLATLEPVVEAAKAWRENFVTGITQDEARLVAAVDALRAGEGK